MSQTVDPKIFGLHYTTKLEQSGNKEFVLIIDRKSRIVMQDGQKILQKAASVMKKVPGATIRLRTTAPVCSKTKALLKENNVEIIS
ncbi:MAG: hypothetical protein GY697_19480 [Desulfobacterales bacterium]|nr:hypothetical protein [Desulfobacterales bacterium]